MRVSLRIQQTVKVADVEGHAGCSLAAKLAMKDDAGVDGGRVGRILQQQLIDGVRSVHIDGAGNVPAEILVRIPTINHQQPVIAVRIATIQQVHHGLWRDAANGVFWGDVVGESVNFSGRVDYGVWVGWSRRRTQPHVQNVIGQYWHGSALCQAMPSVIWRIAGSDLVYPAIADTRYRCFDSAGGRLSDCPRLTGNVNRTKGTVLHRTRAVCH